MSSGGRGSRGNKGPRAGGGDRNTTAAPQQQQPQPVQQQKLDSQAIDKDKSGEAVPHKIAPTAEQLRIAQMIDSMRTEPEKKLQEKMNQVYYRHRLLFCCCWSNLFIMIVFLSFFPFCFK